MYWLFCKWLPKAAISGSPKLQFPSLSVLKVHFKHPKPLFQDLSRIKSPGSLSVSVNSYMSWAKWKCTLFQVSVINIVSTLLFPRVLNSEWFFLFFKLEKYFPSNWNSDIDLWWTITWCDNVSHNNLVQFWKLKTFFIFYFIILKFI